MSTLIPIDGAVQQVSQTLSPVRLGLAVGNPSDIASRAAFDVRNQGLESLSRLSLVVGTPLLNPVLSGFDVGVSESLDLTLKRGVVLMGIDITGVDTHPALHGFTVSRATDASAIPARMSYDIGKSYPQAAMLGFQLRNQVLVPSRLGFQLRSQQLYPCLMGLSVESAFLQPARMGLDIGTVSTFISRMGLDIRGGETFMALVDVYPATYPDNTPGLGGYYPTQFLRPQLTVNGVIVDIVEFTYEKPKNRLGAVFNARVARFDTAGLDPQLDIEFGLMIYDPVTHEETFHRLIDGKLYGREQSIGWAERGPQSRGPNDTVTISAVDVVGDRFGLAPRRAVVMYDPLKVKAEEVKTDNESALRDDRGAIIQPVLIPRYGLGLYDAINMAYGRNNGMFYLSPGVASTVAQLNAIRGIGTGLGFDNVITNIPNYPISRADFAVEGGWHEGVLPLISMYGPLFFDLANLLFVINPTWRLPSGLTPRLIPNSGYQRLNLVTPVKEITNAVVLTYKADAAELALEDGIYYLEVTHTDEPEEPSDIRYGEPGYTRVETVRRVRETHHSIDPSQILAEVEIERKVSTYSTFVAGDGGAGVFTIVHRETQTDSYNGDLKIGHRKLVEGIIASGPDASLELVTVLDEKCEIVWEVTDDPDIMVQTRSKTRIEGLVVTLTDTKSVKGSDGQMHDVRIRHPALVAQESGLIQDDTDMGFGPIREITETLRRTKGNQLDVMVRDFNVLTGTVKNSLTQPRTGSRGTSRYKAQMRHILFRDYASELEIGTRKPAGVNAGELPRNRAIQLGYDVLYYILHPPDEASLTLSGVDLTLDKGSVVIARKRDEDTTPFLIEGLSIKGEKGRGGSFPITMTLQGEEIILV